MNNLDLPQRLTAVGAVGERIWMALGLDDGAVRERSQLACPLQHGTGIT